MAYTMILTPDVSEETQQFYADVISGLSGFLKKLPSKYFYDAAGDKLFRDIMNCPEYYLTGCEMEIFTEQTAALAGIMGKTPFDLVELGAGDCSKSVHLLVFLLESEINFTYIPVDISVNVINYLEAALPVNLPGLQLNALNGDYFEMLEKAGDGSGRRKVILCLGANIGNMSPDEAGVFCKRLRGYLSPGDIVILGFDLRKNPALIRAAYNDKEGITKNFNLNLLSRINRELDADFAISRFAHYCSYDPETGACKSYLISLEKQAVNIRDKMVRFEKDEYIWMEISQKYSQQQIDQMAAHNGFRPVKHFLDSRRWFTDAVWEAKQ